HRADHADGARRPLVRSDHRRPEYLHAPLEDQPAALPPAREERADHGLQVRRVRRRAALRPVAQEAAHQVGIRDQGSGMSNKLLTAAAIAGAMAAVWTMPATLAGQAAKATATSKSMPRTADGKPDLTGTYDLATMTPVERAAGSPLVLTDEQAEKLEQQAAKRVETLGAPIKGDRDAPPVGGDGSAGPAGNVGGYNNFWIDAGSRYSTVDGRKRASILIDPPDGRIPAVTPEARQRMSRNVRPTSDQSAREDDPGFEGGGAYDDPERRPLGERCLMGFGSTSGPPVLPNYFYNNLHQIVQTKDSVLILTEMVHDARVVRMNAEHLPKTITK